MIVILHQLRSLYNVGSIFRTADAVGVEKIYLGGVTPRPIDEFGRPRKKLAKVSLGAEKYLSWEKVGSTSRLINKLKREGYKILAIEQSRKSTLYYKFKMRHYHLNKVVLVLGNEVRGLPSSILAKADKILEIPMLGQKESLNVAVAFGIVAYYLRFCYNNPDG
jgi:tRNA G18 (ribose-2'-O)-methylase SpoU